MAENFTAKQKEIVARKLGYDGPMQGFDDFLNSSPALGMKYATLSDKFATRMVKGGAVVKKYAPGGVVTGGVSDDQVRSYLAANPGMNDTQIKTRMAEFSVTPEQLARATGTPVSEVQNRFNAAPIDSAQGVANLRQQPPTTTAPTTPSPFTAGAPTAPTATTYAPVIASAPTTVAATPTAPVQTASVTQAAAAAPIAAPTPIVASEATAATATPSVEESLAKLEAQQGTVSQEALATAATQAPETTAVAGMEAAQGVAGTVQGAPTREVQAGEMVTGPAVDMARAEEIMARTQAAQGVVTDEMTVQGQLNKLLTGFDAGTPPPWAAASMRAATAQLAARGLGASSLAGQAIIQATLEAATPIAAADAKVFEQMGLQNLSNRQQVAVLVGQQRAAFLGQEFDQAFQTRVLNAAKVSDIANKNFDAQTQIAIENSRLANSMDIANLSARNAVVMGKMAQMSQLETTNLNNRQQAAVENAKAFLTMDIKNLDNRQQTALFKAQELNDALVSDAGFANAISITNSQNKLEADKVSAQLAQSAAQFNADMATKVNMANALAANELSKFNAQQANAREEFNSNNATQINIANAKIMADVSIANTASVNAANAVNAKSATELSAAKYAQESQTYRDKLEMSWKTGENFDERVNSLAIATLSANASTKASETTADRSAAVAIGTATVAVLTNYDKVKLVYDDAKKIVSGWVS